MHINNRANQLLELGKKAYPFAHALVNEDVSAYQLVVDALSRLELASEGNSSFVEICHYCYEQARRSYLGQNFDTHEIFDHLSLEEKAALFLREKEGVEHDEIAFILGTDRLHAQTLLTNARNHFFELLGEQY